MFLSNKKSGEMLKSIIYLAFFVLLLTGCDDGCYSNTKEISILFQNSGDDNIHLFTKIYYVDNEGGIQNRLIEDFDAANRLEPGNFRILSDIQLSYFHDTKGQPRYYYYINFYAGQSGFVFKSVKNMEITSTIRQYDVLWDGENLQVNQI